MNIALEQLSMTELRDIAGAGAVGRFPCAPEGALPPQHVAARALAQLEDGVPASWCVPYVIVERSDGTALGGCTFKGAPVGGGVEIAYGVAASARGRGIATEAVRQLLRLAKDSASVHRVVAEVLPSNIASGKLVARLGFIQGARFVGTDGETVVRWTRELA
jgi:RimJ/RimL family protein N-acetyltransferase